MGLKNLITKSNLNSKDFLLYQLYWGHKKNSVSSFLNFHILGFKNDFIIFNIEHLFEYSKRALFFSSNVIFNKGRFLFLAINEMHKKLNSFFSARSLQFNFRNKWANGSFTNNILNNFFILFCLQPNKSFLKEAFSKLVPVICFEDSDFKFNKPLYSILGNDDSKKGIYFFYAFFSDFLIKSFLLKHLKKRF
jgi:ribosomal protein S2